MDKADSFNAAGGPLFTDVTSALFATGNVNTKAINYIYGLGGRDVRSEEIESIYGRLFEIVKSGQTGQVYNYLGVRE